MYMVAIAGMLIGMTLKMKSVQDIPMKWFLTKSIIYSNMTIYCNTLEGNMQYGGDPYCFIPNAHIHPMDIVTEVFLCHWLCLLTAV